MSSGLSSWSNRELSQSRPYACSRRNCVQVGPIRRGAGPRPPWRSTVATVVAETSMPSFKSSPRILRYPHLGFSRPNRRISSLIAGSRGGRPGRRHGPRGRLPKSSRCHRRRVSGPTRKLLHRSRESNRAAAASNARSAVVKRGRVPPRARIFSWRRSTTVSRSRSSTPQRTSRRSRPQRSRYLRNRSIGQSLTCGRTAGERRGQSTDRVSLPHRVRRHDLLGGLIHEYELTV